MSGTGGLVAPQRQPQQGTGLTDGQGEQGGQGTGPPPTSTRVGMAWNKSRERTGRPRSAKAMDRGRSAKDTVESARDPSTLALWAVSWQNHTGSSLVLAENVRLNIFNCMELLLLEALYNISFPRHLLGVGINRH